MPHGDTTDRTALFFADGVLAPDVALMHVLGGTSFGGAALC